MVVWWAYSTLWFCQNIQNWKAQKVKFISYKLKKKRKEKNQDYKGQKIKYYYKINLTVLHMYDIISLREWTKKQLT